MSGEKLSLCVEHQVAATAVCTRCGRFGCGACLSSVNAEPWCGECLARPEARLTPSPEAKRALLVALLGLHGLVVLLPVAAWLARRELDRITARAAPEAGRPWVHSALAISLFGLVAWSVLFSSWLW